MRPAAINENDPTLTVLMMRLKPLIFILFAALAAYAGYWYYLANHAEERVRGIARELARSGLEFDYRDLDISGFPYRLILDFSGVEVSYVDGPLRLDWSGPSLQAVLQPWQPDHAVFFAPDSLMSISYRTDRTRAVTIEPRLLSASLSSAKGGGARYSLVLEDSRIQAISGSAGETFIGRAEMHFRSRRLQAAGVTVSGLVEPVLADISLSISAQVQKQDGVAADHIIVELQPRGRFFPRLTRYSLAAWRDAGSTIDITSITARWGETRIEGDGSITLDSELQPLGAISLRTSEPEHLLEKMTAVGWIEPEDQQETAEAIKLFRSIAAPGAPITLAISLQGGTIAMGPVILAEFGALVPR